MVSLKVNCKLRKMSLMQWKSTLMKRNFTPLVSGIFSFDQHDPIDSWLHNSVENLVGFTISLPVYWVQVVETNKHVKWPLFTSLTRDRLEKEKLSIPVAAFQFWEQRISEQC